MVDTNMVGQDLGSPPQNPVPKSYQTDPFQTAQVTDTAGTYETTGGFRTKPKAYSQDPFDEQLRKRRERSQTYYDDQTLVDEFAPEYQQQLDDRTQREERQTRLEAFNETGEINEKNVADVYSLKEDELGLYGIDINAPNVGEAPEGITSGWNDADGDGYDDDGHAMGTHGAVNVRTAAGEQSIDDVLNAAGEPVSFFDAAKQKAGEYGRLAQQYAAPQQKQTTWGDTVTTSPGAAVSAALPPGFGAVAAIGGAISKANLEKIHKEHGEFTTDSGFGVIPKDSIPGVNTPLAVSPGFIPGTTVVSGNTDLALQKNPHMDLNQDGSLDATELQNYMKQQEQLQQAQQIEDRRLRELAEQQAAVAAAKAAQEQRQAKERADREARAQEEARRAEAQRRANETGREQSYGGGSAVTDRHGRAVRDSSGQVVTDRHNTVQPQRDRDSGGGGGGDSCFAKDTPFLMADGTYKMVQDIEVGDKMAKGGTVYGVLQGDGTLEEWYNLDGVNVTGSHFVYMHGKWMPVEETDATPISSFSKWYCVLNMKHRMLSLDGILFTDFDAVDSVNNELRERLNAVQER